jgi:homoserine O-acetyltransferase
VNRDSRENPALEGTEGEFVLPGEFALHHGGSLENLRIAWRLVGPAGAPLIVILGGISGHRRVFAAQDDGSAWWQQIAGPGRALPTQALLVLAFDYLGGSGRTTAPRPSEHFPPVSTYDQAEVLKHLLDHLQIDRLRCIVGASYGGMVALAFAARYPARVRQLLVMSAAERAHPMATAWRGVQRRTVRFAIETGRPAGGLALARALAMATYRSPAEFAARFGGEPRLENGRFVFPVEEYLLARGGDYAARYQPDSFLLLSESIDLHRLDATHIDVPVLAIGVREDQLVPIEDMRNMVRRLPQGRLVELSSLYGHDAFLKEADQLAPLLATLTEGTV